jgi:hypothetical protein
MQNAMDYVSGYAQTMCNLLVISKRVTSSHYCSLINALFLLFKLIFRDIHFPSLFPNINTSYRIFKAPFVNAPQNSAGCGITDLMYLTSSQKRVEVVFSVSRKSYASPDRFTYKYHCCHFVCHDVRFSSVFR